jgi:hypothetical protein
LPHLHEGGLVIAHEEGDHPSFGTE